MWLAMGRGWTVPVLAKGVVSSRAQGLGWLRSLLSSVNHPLCPTSSLTHPCPLASPSYSTQC